MRSFGEPMPVGFGIWGLDRRHVCDLDQKEGDFVIDTMLYGLDCFDQLTAQLVKRGGLAEGL